MFSLRDKLKYMALGALIALGGLVFGNINNDTDAQSESKTIDELTVQQLTVLKDITVIADDGEHKVVIFSNENGGKVMCLGPGGKDAIAGAVLEIGESGGVVGVRGGKGGSAGLSVGTEGGRVTIVSASGTGAAAMNIVDGDGVVYTRDRFGEFRSWGQQ